MKKKLLVMGSVGLLALLLSATLVGVALADNPAGEKDGIQQAFIGKVAKFLGVGEQQLKDAVKKAQLEIVDDAVTAGKLTQERASAVKERIQQGNAWGPPQVQPPKGRPGPGPKGGLGWDDVRHLFEIKAFADFLGMKPADLLTEIQQGKTLAQIGQEHGKSRDQLKSAILSAVQKRVDEAVANGKLTQDQANNLKQKADAQVENLLDRNLKVEKERYPLALKIEEQVKAFADFLGVKPVEVLAELKQGKTLAQIGEAHGKTRDQMRTAILTAVQKQLDAAVANGKLTPDQANNLKQKANEQVDNLLDRGLQGKR